MDLSIRSKSYVQWTSLEGSKGKFYNRILVSNKFVRQLLRLYPIPNVFLFSFVCLFVILIHSMRVFVAFFFPEKRSNLSCFNQQNCSHFLLYRFSFRFAAPKSILNLIMARMTKVKFTDECLYLPFQSANWNPKTMAVVSFIDWNEINILISIPWKWIPRMKRK